MLHVWRLGIQVRMQHRLHSNRALLWTVGARFSSVQQSAKRNYVQAVSCRDFSHR